MSGDPEFVRLRDRLAQARRERRDVGKHQERLNAYVRDKLAHEACMTAARNALADLERLKRTTRTLRDTLRFAEARS